MYALFDYGLTVKEIISSLKKKDIVARLAKDLKKIYKFIYFNLFLREFTKSDWINLHNS